MLYICLVTFIAFISFTKVHLFILCSKVQLIHFVIHFHIIHFTDNSPSYSHSSDLVLLILHFISIQRHCVFHFFNQSRLRRLVVCSDKILIQNISCIIEAELWWYYSLLLYKNHNMVLIICYLLLHHGYLPRLETRVETFLVSFNCHWKGRKNDS